MARTSRKKKTTRKKPPSMAKRFKKAIGWPWIKFGKRGNGRKILKALFLLGVWGMIALMTMIFILSLSLPDIRKAVQLKQGPVIIMRDIDGNEFARMGAAQGDLLRVSQMSPWLIKAVIAIEDRRFYSHIGVDPIGLVRAVVANLRHGSVSQGGSTITQQLAKNLFLTPERTLTRKAKEALLAIYLERRYTKDEILAAYLNRAYFGAGAYGVEAASRVYFNGTARNLKLEQAAMLAGLLKAPSRYSPDNNPKLTEKRTRTVLSAMADAGFIKPGSDKMAIQTLAAREYNVGGAYDMRYYADWIMSQVEGYIGTPTRDLVIDTTMDARIQKAAAETVRRVIDAQGKDLKVTQGAMVMLEPNGRVVAMVGGRDYGQSQYNRAMVAMRQPGSSFKPFVYLAALEAGYTPMTDVLDAPVKIGKYAPANFDGKYRGNIHLQDGVTLSLNTVAIRVAQDVGVGNIMAMARRLGISDPLNADLSLALGTSDVHMLPMATAYATLANNGVSVEPYGVRMIRTTDGDVLYEHRNVPGTPVLNPVTVAYMNQMLQSVVQYGTGQRARLDRPTAGKTGTSSNHRDAWFIGYTADYAAAVWVGNDDNSPTKRVTGGSLPAQIWHDVMMVAEQGKPVRDLLSAAPAYVDTQQPQPHDNAPAHEPNMFEQLLNNILGNTERATPNEEIQWNQ